MNAEPPPPTHIHTHIDRQRQTCIVARSCFLRLLTIAPCAISFCFFSFTSRMFLLLPLSVSLHLPTFCALLYWLSISLRFTICRLLVGSGTHKQAQPQPSSVHSCCISSSSSSFCGSRFSAYFTAECVLLLFLPLPCPTRPTLSPYTPTAF